MGSQSETAGTAVLLAHWKHEIAMLASSQWWWVGLLLFILSTGEVTGEDIPWKASGQCQPVYQLECAGCSLRLEKLCEISLEERPVEARLLQCRNITNPACQGGLTTRCSVRFHSSCSTVTETATVVEDRPVCRTERVESCLADSSCRQIKVNRCHIERVTVRKGRPVTKCERIPRKLCA